MKFYDEASRSIMLVDDNTGHLPFCITNLSVDELSRNWRLMDFVGFHHMEPVVKTNPLTYQKQTMTKIYATDPLSIGRAYGEDIRSLVPEGNPNGKVWESNIKYHQSYIYDRDLFMGLPYIINDGVLFTYRSKEMIDRVNEVMKIFKTLESTQEERQIMRRWVQMLETPAPYLHRAAIDIEVHSSTPRRFPDPNSANYPVIAVGIITSDGKRVMLLLRRKGIEAGDFTKLGFEIEWFNQEDNLLKEAFTYLRYPFVFTFNGDNFDLRYLYNRGKKLNIENIPIVMHREKVSLSYGVHIDLYRFFNNQSIKVYAFKNKYANVGLDDVAKGLLGRGKIEVTHDFNLLTYAQLAEYCMNDTELTYDLTSFDNEVVLKLIMVLMRIANLSIEDVTRLQVAQWIRSFMYHEHRKQDILIPWVTDIKAKGEIVTKAIIKGKKYKGAIVIDPPESDIYFNVLVIDFASLYPTVIKEYNLGYTTINCEHEECRDNLVPETTHWVCRKRQALASLLIGTLRDVRVKHYKQQSKRKDLLHDLISWYTCVQEAVKVIMNASYGVMGAESFDLYCPPVAEAITAISRWAILSTIEKCNDLLLVVLYGDTDSIFLHDPPAKKIEELIEWSERELNLELEVDKEYAWVIFSGRKKNYIGKYKDSGKIDFKGVSGKKKHIPLVIRNAFDETKVVLEGIETREDFSTAKQVIKDIVKKTYIKLKRRQWDSLSDLAFHVVLGKNLDAYQKTTPQHVKAARQLVDSPHISRDIGVGDIIDYVKTLKRERLKRGGYRYIDHVTPLELASDEEINVKKYQEQLKSVFAPIMEPLEINFKEDIEGVQPLESFGLFG